jgi:hypothetical protein
MLLFEKNKETLGSSGRVKLFCKYFREIKRFEAMPYNQATNKMHLPDVYHVSSCVKSATDKRYAFDLLLDSDKGYKSVHTYQATSLEDYRTWFLALEGKDLTPVRINISSFYLTYRLRAEYFCNRKTSETI